MYCHPFYQNNHCILSLRGFYLRISLRSPHPPLDRCNHCMVPCHMSPCPLVTCPIITCVRTPHCPDPVLHRLSTDHLQRSWQEPKIHQICRRAKWAKDGSMEWCISAYIYVILFARQYYPQFARQFCTEFAAFQHLLWLRGWRPSLRIICSHFTPCQVGCWPQTR